MAKFRMSLPDVVLVDVKTGRLTADGYDLFKGLERLGVLDLAGMATTAPATGQFLAFNSTTGIWALTPASPPTNGQVLIWNDTTKVWAPGTN